MDNRHRAPSRLGLLVGGASWMLTLLYFIDQLIAQGGWRTPYSLIDNRVSDLGNTECGRTLADTYICSPLSTDHLADHFRLRDSYKETAGK